MGHWVRHLHGIPRKKLKENHIEFPLSPPEASALPPLPPIPLPPSQQPYHRASLIPTSSTPKPISRPPIPSSSYLSQNQTLRGCVEAFSRECKATLHCDDTALLVEIGPERKYGVACVLLRTLRRDGRREDGEDVRLVEVESVKVFSSSESDPTVR